MSLTLRSPLSPLKGKSAHKAATSGIKGEVEKPMYI